MRDGTEILPTSANQSYIFTGFRTYLKQPKRPFCYTRGQAVAKRARERGTIAVVCLRVKHR